MVQGTDDSAVNPPGDTFVRDRPTILSYGALGAYTFWLYAFGPALALLRSELTFSYTMIGVYSAFWAAGAVFAGAVFAPLAGAIGRRAVLGWSALATTAGAALFVLSLDLTVTLFGAVVMGFAGTIVQTTTQSVLADRHGRRRDQALVESNIGAGLAAVVAPLALGMSQLTTGTWRTAMVLPAGALAVLAVVYRHEPPPAPLRPPHRHSSRLTLACWLLCLVVAVGIGVEFSVVYFGAELLAASHGLATGTAATGMTTFYAGILLGRIAVARLTRRSGRAGPLLGLCLGVTLAGLLALWLPSGPPLALCALFLTGLGIAGQFPLALALALAAAPGSTDTANARSQFLGGVLVLAAPFMLGSLADHVGIAAGFAVAPLLTVLSGLLLYAARPRNMHPY